MTNIYSKCSLIVFIFSFFFIYNPVTAGSFFPKNVLGMSGSEAMLELMVNGFSEVVSKNVPVCLKHQRVGTVIDVIPSKVAPNDEITIVVEVQGALVPDIKGLTVNEARRKLKQSGFLENINARENGLVVAIEKYNVGTCLYNKTELEIVPQVTKAHFTTLNKCIADSIPTTVLRAGDRQYLFWQQGIKKEIPALVSKMFTLVATLDISTTSPYFISLFLHKDGVTAELRIVCKSNHGLINSTITKIDGLDRLRRILSKEAIAIQTGNRKLIVWEISRNSFRNFHTTGDIGDFHIGVTEAGIRIPILLKSGKFMLWDSGIGNLGKTKSQNVDRYTDGDRVFDSGSKVIFVGATGWYVFSHITNTLKSISSGFGTVVDARIFKNPENPAERGIFVITSSILDVGRTYRASIIKFSPTGDANLIRSSIDLTPVLNKKDIKKLWLKRVETESINMGVSILIAYSGSRKGTLACVDIGGFGGGESYVTTRWEDFFEKGFDPLQLRSLEIGDQERLVHTDAMISYDREIGADDEFGCVR